MEKYPEFEKLVSGFQAKRFEEESTEAEAPNSSKSCLNA